MISSDSAGLAWLAEKLEALAQQVREEGRETRRHFWYLGESAPIPQESDELIIDVLPPQDD